MCPNQSAIRIPEGKERFVVATNHFNHESMKNFDNKPVDNWYGTLERYQTVNKS
ncbi:hypothetical protein [Vallitalea maricola]|uniref:Uncharacterized protein n=1 Tax=Vallitalea maricola TaxID=3074433 RepID=A0ACB5UGL5_9FIRM|nr:hypothetical protein AN2V17_13280 [Vallitalea sp. AN17-2]